MTRPQVRQEHLAFIKPPKVWEKDDLMSLLSLVSSAVRRHEVSETIKLSVGGAERALRSARGAATPPRWDKAQRLAQLEQDRQEIAAFEEAERRRIKAAPSQKRA
jgi:hypothetical protein